MKTSERTSEVNETSAGDAPVAEEGRGRSWRRFWSDRNGQVMVEYVLLLVGVFVAVNITIIPLKKALLKLAADIVIHASLP